MRIQQEREAALFMASKGLETLSEMITIEAAEI
jgi:hypothetical protein